VVNFIRLYTVYDFKWALLRNYSVMLLIVLLYANKMRADIYQKLHSEYQLNLSPIASSRNYKNALNQNNSLPQLSPRIIKHSESERKIINQSPILVPLNSFISTLNKTKQYKNFHIRDLEVPKLSITKCGPVIAFAANTHKGVTQ
jgi:hypothetical protein